MDAQHVYKDLLWQDPGRMSGALCFLGTRIRVQDMFDHLESGYTLENFCEAFGIPIEKGAAVLELARENLFDNLWKSQAA